jgi:ATP-dependent 26S proteasome regulatory subunit
MREKIWETMFPKSAPKAHDFDSKKLARLDVAGGNIRNIALNAAFMAADAERRITMKDILQATRSEYNKLNKVLTEADKKGIAP